VTKLLVKALFGLAGVCVVAYFIGLLIDAVEMELARIASWFSFLRFAGPVISPVPLVASATLIVLGAAFVRCSLPYRAHRTVCEWLRVRKGMSRRERPRFRFAWPKSRHVWLVVWQMPVGAVVEKFNTNSAVMDEQIDASTRWWYDHGLVWMEAGTAKLPRKIEFTRFAGLASRKPIIEVMSIWVEDIRRLLSWSGWRFLYQLGKAG
jgi:hypothetical protein